MIRIRLGEQKLRAGRHVDAGRLRQNVGVFADEILVHAGMGATAALAFLEGERRLREPFQLRGIQFHRAVLGHVLHQLVRDVVEDENLFLADAQKIVVKRRAGNNRLGRARRAAGVVNKHGRIAGTGADGALAGSASRLSPPSVRR